MRLDKRRSALAVAVPAVVFIALSTQVWVRGTTGDVLSGGAVDVTGGAAAPVRSDWPSSAWSRSSPS